LHQARIVSDPPTKSDQLSAEFHRESLAADLALLGGVLSDHMKPKWLAFGFLVAAAWTSWSFRAGIEDPRSAVVWDSFWWGLAMGGSFVPVAYVMFAVLTDEEFSHGSMILNVVRLVAGSIGTAYSTTILVSRQNAFYDAIASRIEWGSYAAGEVITRLDALTGVPSAGIYNPDAAHMALQVGQSLIRAAAAGPAFQAVFSVVRQLK